MSFEHICLNSEEITALTLNYNSDSSNNNRILTQFKFHCKIQEIQCANIVLLKFSLPEVGSSLDVIAKYVFSMIEMSYKWKFVVSAWLWKLNLILADLQ